jgi:stage III sporulation protein AA
MAWRQAVERDLWPLLTPALRRVLTGWFDTGLRAAAATEEVRLRPGRPLVVVSGYGDFMLDSGGRPVTDPKHAFTPTPGELESTLQLMTGYSLYSREEDLRSLFLTLPGGHRVGLAGRVLVEDGRVRALQHVGSLNLRLARAVPGCALPLVPALRDQRLLASTLVVSPPGCGKTTILRDLARLASDGREGLLPCRVGLVDERSELAACSGGIPQHDVGLNTDVLDGCPKAVGIALLLRGLNPQLVVTDEVGRPEDSRALLDALNAGVKVLASAHGRGPEDVARRPPLRELLDFGAFDRIVVLSRRSGPGTVERVVNGQAGVGGVSGGVA